MRWLAEWAALTAIAVLIAGVVMVTMMALADQHDNLVGKAAAHVEVMQ